MAQVQDTKIEPLKPEINGTNGVFKPEDHINDYTDKSNGLVTASRNEHHGIRWAPLHVPFQRRMQTAAVFWFEVAAGFFLSTFFFMCSVPIFWPILIPYLAYLVFQPPPHNEPPSNWLSPLIRSHKFWANFTNYFPMTLHRTVELSPNENYVFGFHPHGIVSMSAWGHFATKTTGWSELFPGISNTLLTLESNFHIPGYREYLIGMGLGSVSRQSCEGLLGGVPGEVSEAEVHAQISARAPKLFSRWRGKKQRTNSVDERKKILTNGLDYDVRPANKRGRGITICIGGAEESLLARPHAMQLILKKRRGFVKVAIRTGACLVPVLSFGENDIFDVHVPEKSSIVHKVQVLIKKIFGFTIPLFHARGIVNYDVGLVPYRRAVHTVVGKPIHVAQSAHPRDDYIDEIHNKYCEELLRIWHDNKDHFAPNREEDLEFVM